MDNKTKLGALFYPKVDNVGRSINFDTLYIPHIYKEIYFEKVYDDVLRGKKDLTIIDVGSNIGVTVSFFQPYSKKLYAIEPSPEHFEALKKNKEFNEWNNVELFNIALADKDGKMSFSQNVKNRTSSSLIVGDIHVHGVRHSPDVVGEVNAHGYGEKIAVSTQSIDRFFEENNIAHVDFIKFDTEGAEDLILRSEGFKSIVNKIDAIEVEFHLPTWMNLVEYLTTFGFKTKIFKAEAKIALFYK